MLIGQDPILGALPSVPRQQEIGAPAGGGLHPRVLFLVRNRRGLGHMMRGLNVARALRALWPTSQVRFHLRSAPGAGLWPADMEFVLDDGSSSSLSMTAKEFSPDVIVFDTMLPETDELDALVLAAPRARYAFVMRRCLDEEQAAVYAHPALTAMDCIIVPHTAEEFGHPLPPRLAPRCQFVGPIVRRPDRQAQAGVKSRYGIQPGDLVITSTVGGGGFALQAQTFFDTIGHVHAALLEQLPPPGSQQRWHHIVILGPHFTGELTAQPGMQIVSTEPQLVDLMAVSSLVIAEGGYNTVSELGETGTPALFLPSARGKDDQHERVQRLVDAGCAASVDVSQPKEVASRVLKLLTDPSALAGMRRARSLQPRCSGNEAAAAALATLSSLARGTALAGTGQRAMEAARSVLVEWMARQGALVPISRVIEVQGATLGSTVHELRLSQPIQGLTRSRPIRAFRSQRYIVKSAPVDQGAERLLRTQLMSELAHRQSGLLVVPEALDWWSEQGVMLQVAAQGIRLSEIGGPSTTQVEQEFIPVEPGSEATSLLEAVTLTGRALATIHRLPMDSVPLYQLKGAGLRPTFDSGSESFLSPSLDEQMEQLFRPHPRELMARCPRLASLIADLTTALHQCLDPTATNAAQVSWLHRDIHPRQIFVDGQRVEVIDWDLSGWGDPGLDVGNLQLHLARRWPTLKEALWAALAEGYGPGWSDFAARLPAWRCFHLLRRACKAWRLRQAQRGSAQTDRAESPPADLSDEALKSALDEAMSALTSSIPAQPALHATACLP